MLIHDHSLEIYLLLLLAELLVIRVQGNLLLHLLDLLLLLGGLHLLHGLLGLGSRRWLHYRLDLLLLLQLVHLLHLLELLLLLGQLVLEDGLGDLLLLLHLLLSGLLGLELLRLEVGLLLRLLEVRLLLLLELEVLKIVDALLGELAANQLRVGEHMLKQRLVVHLLERHDLLLNLLRLGMELLLALRDGRGRSLLLTELNLVEGCLRSCELPSDNLLGGLLLRGGGWLSSLLLELLLNVDSLSHLVSAKASLGLSREALLGLLGELLLGRNLHIDGLRLANLGLQLLVLDDLGSGRGRVHADHLRLRLGNTDALGVLRGLASSVVSNSTGLGDDRLSHLLGCCNLMASSHLSRSSHRLRLLLSLLFSFLDATLGILLLPLGLLFVLRDAVLDILLQVTAQVDGELSELKSHLVVIISLGELLHDLNDALRLLVGEAVDLSDQVVTLFDSQSFVRSHGSGFGTADSAIAALRDLAATFGTFRLLSNWLLLTLLLR